MLINFPETATQFQALKELGLEFERMLCLKAPEGDESVTATQVLEEQGFGADAPLEAVVGQHTADLDEFVAAAGDSVKFEDVPMNIDAEARLIAVRKLIDPFYPVVKPAESFLDIPDPDEWVKPEEEEADEEEGVE